MGYSFLSSPSYVQREKINMEISDYFYTVGQVAELMNVTRISVWRWVQGGKFNAQRVGAVVLIPKWEVELLKVTKRRKHKGAKV
jgi:excisionase family DNA binding protein